MAESVLMPFLGAAMSGAADVRLEAALDAFVIAVPDIPETDLAAIHARWKAEERAPPAAVDRSLGIDNDSDT